MSWTKHVEHIAKKATKRLYFFGLPPDHLLHVAVIRPVLEYCSYIWHHNIINKLSLQIEAIQKRAIKIIFHCTRGMSYAISLYVADLSSLQHRRQHQARDFFFQSLLDPNSCLHSLLPAPRDHNLVARLRAARRFPVLASRTKKIPVFYKFWPPKLSINLGPFGKSVVYLYYFYSLMFTLVTHRFVDNCICTVLLLTWLFCSLYSYSATLAAKLMIKLD